MITQRQARVARYLLFVVGVICMALGVSLVTLADLGTTPITALPYVASLASRLSLGFFSVLNNLALIALQRIVLGRQFHKRQYLQIPAAFLMGFFIDFWMRVIPVPLVWTYPASLFYLALGVTVQGLGIVVQVSADVVILAGEGAVVALTTRTRRNFGVVKTCFDATLVMLAILLSLHLFGTVRGVREGTVVSALCGGLIANYFFRLKKSVHTRWKTRQLQRREAQQRDSD